MLSNSFWKNKKVLITGHTGFKGSWLSLILLNLESKVFGISLEPHNKPNLFNDLNLTREIGHNIVDIRNKTEILSLVRKINPDCVFHLAAQPLVREGYKSPVYTWETNLNGTINVLESLRLIEKKCSAVIVTTDKVYKEDDSIYGYRETDSLGGYDPYSSSKAAVELAVDSWRKSFLNFDNSKLFLATARAGNVIGGGDWSIDRIIPDLIRGLELKKVIKIRNPYSTRPWQHVIEPLMGYIVLAEKLYLEGPKFTESFNFGPGLKSNRKVCELIEEVFNYWPGEILIQEKKEELHEANKLNLSNEKAYRKLNWEPKWNFEETVEKTINWYKNFYAGKKSIECCLDDINCYLKNKRENV